ncbi:MAG: PLP-dependent aminotransferase family protein, partial [Chloroflexi bacterium]
ADAWEEASEILSSYGEPHGYLPLREAIAERMTARGVPGVDPEYVFITNGSQQGLDLSARALFDPGDVVIVEGPTYFGAIQAFDAYQVRYLIAPVDDQGIDPDQLEPLLHSTPRPKALYTVPSFQNPTGVTLSQERRQRIAAMAREANVAIIEDDPYSEIYFGAEPAQPFRALDEDIIYLGTFSKTLAPALRMGWMVVPPKIFDPIANSKEAVDLLSDKFVQRAVYRTMSDGWLDHHLLEARAFYRRQRDQMLAALEREMPPGVRWTTPEGGFFTWVTLPGSLTSEELLARSLAHHVGFYPGSCFFPEPVPHPGFRMSYPTLPHETIDEGVRRIGLAARELLDR